MVLSLESTFSKCGEVTDVYNTGKGFAFVTMADQSGFAAAIDELHGTEIDGRELKVEQAKPREKGRSGRGMNGSFGSRGGHGDGSGGYGGGSGACIELYNSMGACYNCKRSGHISRDCPEVDRRGSGGYGGRGGRGGGGGGRGCYNCNQDGHMARDCPESDRRSRY
jgi:hypothetical protein